MSPLPDSTAARFGAEMRVRGYGCIVTRSNSTLSSTSQSYCPIWPELHRRILIAVAYTGQLPLNMISRVEYD
jgi:hypothetical protein